MIAEAAPVLDGSISCSVIICAYTERRWDQLELAYRTSADQAREGDEVIVVIDHNPDLLARAVSAFTRARVIENAEERGLSGARNTGVAAATGDVTIFLDDDACPEPGWLAAYRRSFARPEVTVVSGAVAPNWEAGRAPSWFPDEFGWVVGCDYRGLPPDGSVVRNPIGANMAIRRSAFDLVDGFSAVVGRVGTLPVGCEETDLCIRIRQADPRAVIIRTTEASVRHAIPADRGRLSYFLSRCYHEGRSKAVLTDRVGSGDGLSSEVGYVASVLTTGVLRGLPLRSAAIVAGFSATVTGYVGAKVSRVAHAAGAPEQTGGGGWAPLRIAELAIDADGRPVGELGYADALADALADSPADSPSGDGPDRPAHPVRTRLLVTRDGNPVDTLDLAPGHPLPEARLRELAAAAAAMTVPEVGADVFTGADGHTPSVTVVIPTRGRSAELRRAVASVLASDYPDFDVVVVDNNDTAGSVAALLAPYAGDTRLSVVHEPVAGVSPARNRGIAGARGEIIAATDDDVVVSRQWLRELVAPFADASVGCVTGLVLPAGFASPAQEMFEEFGGFSKGFRPARYRLADAHPDHPLFPYAPGVYGSGNNMAYRRDLVARLGGYNRTLGPGTPVKSGEDLDLFLTLMFDGATIYYQPRAWVFHHHRDSVALLGKQLRDYGRGLTAVMLSWALSSPEQAVQIARRVPAGVRHLLDPHSDKNEARTEDYPAALRRTEWRGMVEGGLLTLGRLLGRGGSLASGRRPLALAPIATTPAPHSATGPATPLHSTDAVHPADAPREMVQHAR